MFPFSSPLKSLDLIPFNCNSICAVFPYNPFNASFSPVNDCSCERIIPFCWLNSASLNFFFGSLWLVINEDNSVMCFLILAAVASLENKPEPPSEPTAAAFASIKEFIISILSDLSWIASSLSNKLLLCCAAW